MTRYFKNQVEIDRGLDEIELGGTVFFNFSLGINYLAETCLISKSGCVVNDLPKCMHNQSHYTEVAQGPIFMEQNMRFGLILSQLAILKKKIGPIMSNF